MCNLSVTPNPNLMPASRPQGKVIKALSSLFRGASFILGMTAPSSEEEQRRFVFLWLAIIVFVLLFCVLLVAVLSRMALP